MTMLSVLFMSACSNLAAALQRPCIMLKQKDSKSQCCSATDLALAARAEVMVGHAVACLLAVSTGLLDLLHHARPQRPHSDLDP